MEPFAVYSHAIVAIALWALLVQVLNLMTATAKGKLGMAPGATPAADYADRTYRINRAYLNAVETLAVFGAVTVAAILAGASPFWVNLLASVAFVARLLMVVVHVQGVGKVEWRPTHHTVRLRLGAAYRAGRLGDHRRVLNARPGYHLAELNIGRLVAPTDDPRVAEFMAALDRVNGLGKRMPGFVWMMEGSGEPGTGNTDTKLDGDPQFVANLTVWEDAGTLERFVFNTVHRVFLERRAEWFEVMGKMHFVMWWVPAGHRPSLDEALDRLDHCRAKGDSDHAFGWSYLKDTPSARGGSDPVGGVTIWPA